MEIPLRMPRVVWSFPVTSLLLLALALASATTPVATAQTASVPANVSISLPVAAKDPPPALNRLTITMASDIDRARTSAGLQPLAVSGRLTRASQRYARYMLAHNRWGHASNITVKGFRRVGEILGMAPSHVSIGAVVDAWLHSPIHREVMLEGSYRYFGVGSATGRFQGRNATVWVVRLGR
jgi:uncharacterized protein YkwD